MMDHSLKNILLHVCLPLFLGGTIYYCCRSGSYLALAWLKDLNLGNELLSARQSMIVHFDWVPAWVRFNLPDGLWLYAFLSANYFIWQKQYLPYGLAWAWMAIGASIISEGLQGVGLIQGTFDWFDLLMYSMSTALYIAIFHQKLSFTLIPVKI